MFRDRAYDALRKAEGPALERIRQDRKTPGLPRPVDALLGHIEDHLFEPGLTVGSARKALAIRSSSVSSLFKDWFGTAPADYIKILRLETAQRMLWQAPRLPEARIGRAVGFETLRTFSDSYKDWAGLPPAKDRERNAPPEIRYSMYRRAFGGELAPEEGRRLADALRRIYPDPPAPGDGPGEDWRIEIDGATYEHFQAYRLWKRIGALPGEEQKARVRAHRFHSPALFDLLRKKSREEGRLDRRRGIELAELALVSLEGHEEVFGERIHEHRALGWAYLGQARRLAVDFEGAEAAFAVADEEWSVPRATKDLGIAAEILLLEGTLRMFRRRFDEAVDLLTRSLAFSRSAENERLQLQTLIQRAAAHGYAGDAEAAFADHEKATDLVEPVGDPFLGFVSFGNLAIDLARAGEPERAAGVLTTVKNYWRRHGDPLGGYGIEAIEGFIEQSLGNQKTAEALYEGALRGFVCFGESMTAGLVTLDLAILHVETGRDAQALGLASEVVRLLEPMNLDREVSSALILVSRAVAEGEVSRDLLLQLRDCLARDPKTRLL